MSYLQTAEEITDLEKIFKKFLLQVEKRKTRRYKKTNKTIISNFLENKLLIYSGVAYVIFCLIYYITNTIKLFLSNIYLIRLILLLGILISLLSFIVALVLQEFKSVSTAIPESQILSRSERRRNYVLISKINSYSIKAINSFEERLKYKLEQLKENTKDLDTYLPLFIIIMFVATRYILGIDVSKLGNNVNSFTGGLSFIASASIVVKILAIQSPKKKIRYYKKILLVLKEAEIERNNI